MDPLGLKVHDTFSELRKFFGADDSFMTAGYGTKKIRKSKGRIPSWANDQEKIKAVLLRSFPRLATDSRQRARAGRWVRVMYLHYQRGWTTGQIAEELTCTYTQIHSVLQHIRRAFSNRAANGSGPLK